MPVVHAPPPLRWDGSRLHVLDQTVLPEREEVVVLTGAADTADAIRRLVVRGAPLIGVVAGYGLAMEVAGEPSLGALERGAEQLRSARPTAANLAWALDRVAAAARAAGPAALAGAARAEAEAIEAENAAAGARAVRARRRPARRHHARADALQHRRAGLRHAEQRARRDHGHGRPRSGAPRAGVRDPSAAPGRAADDLGAGARRHLARADRRRRRGRADPGAARSGAVVVGFDRMAANGDTANKVGTYGHALAARAAGIPFVFAGPRSSIDASLRAGEEISIEERDGDEVRRAGGALITVPGTPVRNPAFDVTPADLITAVVTEAGIAQPVDRETIAALMS